MTKENWHREHAERFIEAVAIGEVADILFELACRRLGLRLERALQPSPLLAIAIAEASREARH